MGLGIGDFNLDGSLDIVKTHFRDDTPAVYVNDGKGNFRDVTMRSGLAVETRFVSWGAGIADLDNDGNPDIFWVTGSIYPEVEKEGSGFVPYNTPRVVFRNLGNGRFEELIDEAGPGVEAATCEPRLRVRRFRQRWRRGHSDRQSERAALPAAERRKRRQPLDQGQADRRRIESQRDRRACYGALR